MKLDQRSLDYITAVIKTADLVKINNIIIEPGKIRAIDDERTVAIFHEENVPDMPFGSIGINRLDVFGNRIELAKNAENFAVDVEVKDEGTDNPWAKTLTFKGKGIKIEYRCANPKTIQAPKTFADREAFSIQMNSDAIALIQKGMAAMKADTISIFGTEDGTYFEMADVNGDALTYRFGDVAGDLVEGEATNFSHKYTVKTILPVLKLVNNGEVIITSRGLLKIKPNGLTVYALPNVN